MLSITQHVDNHKIAIPENIKALGTMLMMHHKQAFPFAAISPTVHQMCAHAWELFQMNNGKPIAAYSEQSSEAWNKYIRAYKSGCSSRARQFSIRVNTQDIFQRICIQSHPLIASKKRQYCCSKCHKIGHTIRSCTLGVPTVDTLEISEIQACFIYQTHEE